MTRVDLEFLDPNGWKPWHVAAGVQASRIMEDVINDDGPDSFLAQVASATFSYSEYHSGGQVRHSVPSSEIRDIIRNGREASGAADGVIQLRVKLIDYGPCTRQSCYRGYVTPGTTAIHTNRNWIDLQVDGLTNRKMRPDKIAAHWMHEWMHVAGFRHRNQSNDDPKDVAYQVGTLFEGVASKSKALLAKHDVDVTDTSTDQPDVNAVEHNPEHAS